VPAATAKGRIVTGEKIGSSVTAPKVPWRLSDVLVVAAVISLTFVAAARTHPLHRSNTTYAVIHLIADVIMVAAPIVLLKKRYGLSVSKIGLTRGAIAIKLSVALGIATALLYSFVVHLLLRVDSQTLWRAAFYSPIRYLALMFVPHGFLTLAFAPVCEEVLFRGFFYTYLRNRLGFVVGIATQAVVFGLVHSPEILFGIVAWGAIAQGIAAGLILGILYEITGSVISSAVCHSVLNYYAFIFRVLLSQ
jgi:membrane protease YdiL (CAAX protease family)